MRLDVWHAKRTSCAQSLRGPACRATGYSWHDVCKGAQPLLHEPCHRCDTSQWMIDPIRCISFLSMQFRGALPSPPIEFMGPPTAAAGECVSQPIYRQTLRYTEMNYKIKFGSHLNALISFLIYILPLLPFMTLGLRTGHPMNR